MILADKIIELRKRNGWSQEELAERMQVSRQAVSKWEGAQALPDLERILALSRLFGVSTDYLLKDEIELDEAAGAANGAPTRRVTLTLAGEFLDWRWRAAVRIAAGVLLCVIAVLPLMILGAASEVPAYHLTEDFACGIGMVPLLVFVAIAAGLFVSCGMRNAPYEFIDKEPFAAESGAIDMVQDRQRAFRPAYIRGNVLGTCLCILSPVPLFVGIAARDEFLTMVATAGTMLLAGIGAACFIVAGVRWASIQKLLQEGEFAPREKRKERVKSAVAGVYWLIATAVFLGWSFGGRARMGHEIWKISWIVWPVAGVLFAALMCLCNLWMDRKEN